MSMVVVLPAPLGPRKATVSPGRISRSMPRTACTSPKSLVTPWRWMARRSGVPRLAEEEGLVVMAPAWSRRAPVPTAGVTTPP